MCELINNYPQDSIADASELGTRLYHKLLMEQNKYRNELISKSPAEILELASEYAVRESIFFTFKRNDLTAEQSYALLLLDNPMEVLCCDWMEDSFGVIDRTKPSQMDLILNIAERRAYTTLCDRKLLSTS